MLVTTIYAIRSKQEKITIGVFAFICMGIWWTAVYTGHHYIIDVLLGIATTIIGIVLLETSVHHSSFLRNAIIKYERVI